MYYSNSCEYQKLNLYKQYIFYSLTEGYQLKNLPPPIPVANQSNRAEVNKTDNPVSGKDTAVYKNIDRGTSSQPNQFRKVKGMAGDF